MKREMSYAFQATAEILASSRDACRRVGLPHRAPAVVIAELQAALAWERFGRGMCSARDVPDGARETHGILRRICGGCSSIKTLDAFWTRVRTAVMTLTVLNDATAVFPDPLAMLDAHDLCYAAAAHLIRIHGGRAMRDVQSSPE